MENPARPIAYRVVVIAAVVACLPALGIPIGLFAEGDALDYRVPILKWLARHHAYPNWPWTQVDDYPMLGELLMLPFFLVKQEFARIASMLGYLATAWLAGQVGAELSRREGEAKKEAAAFLFACALGFQPLLVQACHVMVDNIANAFALATFLMVLRGRARAAGGWLAAALATRYSMWGVAPGAVLAWLTLRKGQEDRWRGAITLGAIGFCGALPFLARNLVVNHNPFYPLLDGAFNGVPYTTMDGWARGTGLVPLLLFPFDLFYTHTFVSELFDTHTIPDGFYTYRLGFLSYLQLAVALGALVFARGRVREALRGRARDPRWQALGVFGVCLFFFWWFGSQILRYLGHDLALLNVVWLLPLLSLPRRAREGVALASLLSIAAVQGEVWRVAGKRQESFRESAYAKSAESCFARAGVPLTAVMGWSTRDALNGYFDYEWVFYPPNNLFRLLPGAEMPKPDFIYSGIDFHPIEGYVGWPKEKPCLMKRVE